MVVKKPRSALEKVLAKYGSKEEEETVEVAKVVPQKNQNGDKSIIGFKDVHTVNQQHSPAMMHARAEHCVLVLSHVRGVS